MTMAFKDNATPEEIQSWRKTTVTVCSACLRATCWQGLFYCDEYRTAGTVEKAPELLKELNLEHPDYWVHGKGESA